MKNLQVNLPDLVHSRLQEFAHLERISVEDLLVVAASREIERQEACQFLRRAASGYDPEAFASALAKVPDVAPASTDIIVH